MTSLRKEVIKMGGLNIQERLKVKAVLESLHEPIYNRTDMFKAGAGNANLIFFHNYWCGTGIVPHTYKHTITHTEFIKTYTTPWHKDL